MAALRQELRRLVDERAALLDQAKLRSQGGHYEGLWDLVAREGREFRPVPIPTDLRRRRARTPHKCFDRTFSVALDRDDLLYVEGIAGPYLTHHAWLTSGEGEAIDLAWDFDAGTEYLGIAISTDSLGRATLRRNEIGGYLEDIELFRNGFGPTTLERAQESNPDDRRA